jgi:hypothetical protein
VDWDCDGTGDLLVGDADGRVRYFHRSAGGDLHQMPPVQYLGRPLMVRNNAAPAVTDWNGDGLPDLVVGSFDGYPAGLHLYLNSGVPGSPLFEDSTAVLSGGSPVTFYKAYPQAADMDSDGLFDLVTGSADGYVYCLVNEGSPGAPLFGGPVELESGGAPIWHISATRPCVADYDSDGTWDLLVSDQSGMVFVYPGLPTGIAEDATPLSVLSVVPLCNPAGRTVELRVEGAVPGPLGIDIYSIDGRLVSGSVLDAGEATFDVSIPLDAAGGVYLARVRQDGAACTTRFAVGR